MTELLYQVRPILITTVTRWKELTQSTPKELLAQNPAPEEWSAVECLQHIVDTEKVFQTRVRAFLDGRDFPAFNPDIEGTRTAEPSPGELADEFSRLRVDSLRMLESLVPSDLDRQARHAELGPVTLRMMVNEWAAHDLNHTIQAEQALMQPFLQNCGPWQKYFTDHLITA